MTRTAAARNTIKRSPRPRSLPFRSCPCGFQVNTATTTCPACKAALAAPEKKPRARQRHPEDDHQAALFRWAAFSVGAHPELELLYHVPNGGARNVIEASRMKAQGVRKGVPDINLDVPRGAYHGLRIELKATREELGRNPVVSPEQLAWLGNLARNGYEAVVCYGWEHAKQVIERYLGRPRPLVPAP